MKSKLLDSIKKLEDANTKEMNKIRSKCDNELYELKKQCKHVDEEGISALIKAGHPWHSGWDMCRICGKYIETNEYGRR